MLDFIEAKYPMKCVPTRLLMAPEMDWVGVGVGLGGGGVGRVGRGRWKGLRVWCGVVWFFYDYEVLNVDFCKDLGWKVG